MRILYFSRSYTTHDRRFLVELAATHHEVWYLRLEGGDPTKYELRSMPEGVREIPPLGGRPLAGPEQWIRLAPRLEARLAEVRPDLVHAGPVQNCSFLAALAGFHPLVAMSWGSDLLVDADRDEFWTWVTQYALRRADMLVTDCGEVSRKAHAIAGVGPDRIAQFPWGVDLAAFRPGPDTLQVRRNMGGNDRIIAISTRSWEPSYGIMHVLEGFRLAHREAPQLALLLLGAGSLQKDMEDFVRKNHLHGSVFLVGAVAAQNLPEYFRAADIYVSGALSDGSSLSLLEAMATGLPVIVTDRPSNREWVGEPGNGYLAPFGDSSALSTAFLKAAALSPSARREIAGRNRTIVEERADWKRNIRTLWAVYDRLRDEVTTCPSSAS